MVFEILIYLERFPLQGVNCIDPSARTEPMDSHEPTTKQLLLLLPKSGPSDANGQAAVTQLCGRSQAPLEGERKEKHFGRNKTEVCKGSSSSFPLASPP